MPEQSSFARNAFLQKRNRNLTSGIFQTTQRYDYH